MNPLRWYQVDGRKFIHLSDGSSSYPLCASSQAPLYYAEILDVAPRNRVCLCCEVVAERRKLTLPPIKETARGNARMDHSTRTLLPGLRTLP